MLDKNIKLFKASDGKWITVGIFEDVLKKVGADKCDVLFIQTEIMFGIPNMDLRRKELLGYLSDILLKLNVKNIVLATFSYSFANNENYNINDSKTSMGALLEYMRKLPDTSYRTGDPLLSVSIIGDNPERFEPTENRSLGIGSTFDKLHHEKNCKFLMFGGEFGESFTYVHHIEKMLNVPYRYDQVFEGLIINQDGMKEKKQWYINTACKEVEPRNFYDLEDELVEKGYMEREKVGDSKIVCVSEFEAYNAIKKKIENNPYYFLQKPYDKEKLTPEYKYGKNGERVTHC